MPRFTAAQYAEAIDALKAAREQLEPDGRCCLICTDNDHQAWECGRNPLLAMSMCAEIAKGAESLHQLLHRLAGYDFAFCNQLGPAKIIVPDGASATD